MSPLDKSRRRFISASLPILLVISLAGVACSSGEASEPTVELPTAEIALENALTAMASVPQFQFELTHPEGKTSLPGGLELRRADGSVITPERLEVAAEADLGRVFVKIDAIVIEGRTWMTNPVTGNWAEIAPEDSPFSFLDPVLLVTNILAQTMEPTYPPEGGLADGNRIRLNGKVASEAWRPLVGTIVPGEMLDVALTLDASSFRLVGAVLTGRLQPGDEDSFTRRLTFSGFDANLSIEPPL